ncbi:DUF2513 domain-containing protein [Sutcliffiella cohnii]
MKRDMEIVRALLLEIEEFDNGQPFELHPGEENPYTEEQFYYHIKLLIDSGLVNGEFSNYMGGPPGVFIKGISWEGHDFLDAARDEIVWSKASQVAEGRGSKLKELPFELIKALLIETGKKMLFGGETA